MRKPRPLTRELGSLRDDRLFIVACDDQYAPKQYFNFLRLPRIQVHVVETQDGKNSAAHVLERLMSYKHDDDDELWMLLDTDHYITATHLAGFTQAIKEAKQKGVNVALSRPCFELWLLLHHLDESHANSLENAKRVEQMLREKLGEYNKTKLKPEHYPRTAIAEASKRAARLDQTVSGGDIPSAATTRLYLLINSITSKLPFWQQL